MSSPSERSARGEAQKRKSSRSVSNLTPSQLERKRANDREAQRNIRLRTKETIERLTRENRELYSQKQALQNELDSLRGHTRPQAPGGQYSAAVLAHGGQLATSGYSMGHFPGMANFGYVQPEHHYSSNMLHGPESSNVSSPSSSGQGDDTPAYMHTSNSPPMGDPHSQPGTSGVGSQYVKSEIVGSQYIKGELLDTQISDPGYMQPRQLTMPVMGSSNPSTYLSQQSTEDWQPAFPPPVAYQQSRHTAQPGNRHY